MGPVQGVVFLHRGPSSVEAWAQGEKPARMGDQTLVLLPLPLHIAHGPVLPDLTGYHRQGTLALFLDPQPFFYATFRVEGKTEVQQEGFRMRLEGSNEGFLHRKPQVHLGMCGGRCSGGSQGHALTGLPL